jgi:hypothetical protein
VVYVSDQLVVYGRPGGATRGKQRILDEKVESDLMSNSEVVAPSMSIEDRSSGPSEQY